MGRQRVSYKESELWFHPSQVFTDTQRVDLFNDPKWETAPLRAPGRVRGDDVEGLSVWSLAKSAMARLVPMKRGQHSHNPA
jgi:hypothetical protein